jgi:hypothetical protein
MYTAALAAAAAAAEVQQSRKGDMQLAQTGAVNCKVGCQHYHCAYPTHFT